MIEGQFIVVEGVRGSGKTTLIKGALKKYGGVHVHDFGPAGFPGKVRRLFLQRGLSVMTRLALSYAQRLHVQENEITPLLTRGHTVFCERWYPSVEAYLLYPNGLSPEITERMNKLFGIRNPDLIVIRTVDFDVAMERLRKQVREPNVFEAAGKGYMRKVCHYYNSVCEGIRADSFETGVGLIGEILDCKEG